ncbi:MAG: Nif3-like dinuclear metal center hexameric protein [Bacteroidales bacterium]|nr:Nif3-like dinuclear metal center hexameric protein [Bacteroidales bacterium]
MKLREITAFFEKLAPLVYQESYDNSGLQVGDYSMELTGALITLDITGDVLDEAIENGINLILGHHPLIFGGIQSITGKNMVERILYKAIRNDIAIYSAHTNFDAIKNGVNGKICEVIGLKNSRILEPAKDQLKKLVVFVPENYSEKVRNALFEAGAGVVGNYDNCSYNTKGTGTFKGNEDANPFIGEKGEIQQEPEVRIETIFPVHAKGRIITAMMQSHPYEEVAYDVYSLENKYHEIGMGMIGELSQPVEETQFLELLKSKFSAGVVRHSELLGKKIKKVAVCGGAGSVLLKKAIAEKADVFISGDFKYHQFFDADSKILIADIGHFESEQYTREVFYDLLIKNFPKFAVRLSKINTNPIKYF